MYYFKYVDSLHVSLKGKTYIVTGANSGLGFDLSVYLTYLGATVIMACRNKDKAMNAIIKIKQINPEAKLIFEEYDQASFSSIETFASNVTKYQVNGIIYNAGIYFPKNNAKTVDGLELTVGTNYFGQFYLNQLLKDKLIDKKIVIVSSLVAYYARDININEFENLSRNKLYAYSKLLLNREAYELSSLKKYNVTLVHPGVCATNILFNKDTGLSSKFAKLGRKFLNLFTHSSKKASLCLLCGVIYNFDELKLIKPRGLFAISGYPKISNISKKYRSKNLINETISYIKERINKNVNN